jgi:hypothetical protein
MKRLNAILTHITGGRPMIPMESHCFTDIVSGERVGKYVDGFGRFWMAASRWSAFRVPCIVHRPTNNKEE